MMTFVQKVKNTIDSYSMLDGRTLTTVIVGLSGGADSISLLTVLDSLKSEYNLNLVAAHVNHGIRGAEAKRDEDFAVNYCKELGIRCEALHADVPQLARTGGLSVEACGRTVRYDFFASLAENETNAVVATAHNAQDAVETMLFNMTRGSGLKGLCGIPPVRVSDDKCKIIRPLIDCTRAEIEEYLNSQSISFVTDSTNLDDDYSRNRIRLNVIPELEKINSGAVCNITRLIASLRDDEIYLEELSNKLIKAADRGGWYDTKALIAAPTPILCRALQTIVFNESGVHMEKKHIDEICDKIDSTGRVQIPSKDYVAISHGALKIEKFLDEKAYAVDLSLYKTEKISIESFKKSDNIVLENALDCDKINGKLFFRTRREGDRFRPPYRNLSKSLKSLFNELKIPAAQRDNLAMLEGTDEILWIEGVGPADGYTVTNKTREVLYIYVQ